MRIWAEIDEGNTTNMKDLKYSLLFWYRDPDRKNIPQIMIHSDILTLSWYLNTYYERNYLHNDLGFNPLTHGQFSETYFNVLWEGGKTKFLDFFFIAAFATKRFARSRILRYGCLMIILRKRQKERGGGTFSAPPPPPMF